MGDDGETHQGLFDVPFLSTVPGMTVYSPGNYSELKTALKKCLYAVKGPCALRYPRGSQPEYPSGFDIDPSADFSVISHNKSDILLITYGRIYGEAAKAVRDLKNDGHNVHIMKLNRILPLPEEAIAKAFEYKTVMFAEESYKNGAVCQMLAELLMEKEYKGRYIVRAVNDFVKHASVKSATASVGLDAHSLKNWITENNFENKDF